MKENLLEVINELAKEKGIDRDDVIQIVEEAIEAAARKKLSKYNTIEAQVNQKTGEIELFQYKRVASVLQDPENEILLEDAQAMDDAAEEGDEVEYEIEEREFNRIAQSARQLIFKKIKEAEREIIYNTFKERKGEILTGTVVRTEQGGRIAINFNRVEAYLFRREQIFGERFDHGDHIRVYLMDVNNDPRQPSQLILSRTHPGFLMKLFEMEVPEVYDDVVEVINAAREPGKRAKVSVYTSDPDVDPVGACVGMRGSRVQSIVNELRGEKIDIVRWSEDLPTYLQNALAPAEIERMEIMEEGREIHVWVEQDQLSLAIGRQGQNVRLASKLLGFKINVSPMEERSTMSIDDQIALELGKDFSTGSEDVKDEPGLHEEVQSEKIESVKKDPDLQKEVRSKEVESVEDVKDESSLQEEARIEKVESVEDVKDESSLQEEARIEKVESDKLKKEEDDLESKVTESSL
ncbi:MAG: transcription termination/antitermination protein NusA [SAR324 cluster bacterium]|nr:transcription termination/antitermination protein NusA [SAR324 cluster bacterium]